MSVSVKLSLWKPWVQRFVTAMDPKFKGGSWGTYPGHDPNENLAADCMVPNWQTDVGIAWGNKLANSLANVATCREWGIWYIIWRGRIWSMTRPEQGWLPYFDRNNPNPSRSHKNHVHVSFYNKDPRPAGNARPAPVETVTMTVIKNTVGYYGPGKKQGKVRFKAGQAGHGKVGQKLSGRIVRLKDGKYLVTRHDTYYPAQNNNFKTKDGKVFK